MINCVFVSVCEVDLCIQVRKLTPYLLHVIKQMISKTSVMNTNPVVSAAE